MLNLVRKLIPSFVKESSIYKTLKSRAPHDSIYTDEYYARDVEQSAVQSADCMAQSIIARCSPRSVIDIGCGTGALLAAFRARGCTAAGLEYAEAGLRRCRERNLDVKKFDIESETLTVTQVYDVAISVEVAEHLPASTADRYVSLLCRLAPVVICSAARPGQGGTDHVNLQFQSYWTAKFGSHGHKYDKADTEWLAERWSSEGVAGFYHENIMVFRAPARGGLA